MPNETSDPLNTRNNRLAWLLPILALLFTLMWGVFTRVMVGIEDRQDFDFGTIPFVPGESPHSSGTESR